MGRSNVYPGMDDGQRNSELKVAEDMAGMTGKNNLGIYLSLIEGVLTAILFIPALNHSILIDDRGLMYFLIPASFFISVPIIFAITEYLDLRISRYFSYLQVFNSSLMVMLFLYYPSYLVFAIIILVFSLLSINWTRKSYASFLAYMAFSMFMYYLGESLQFISQPSSASVTVIPLKYIFIFPGQPLPWIYSYGVNIYGSIVTLTVSPLIILIFTSISILAVDNFYGIFRILSRSGNSGMAVSGVQGIAGALSCQCEGCIGLLPSVAAAIVTIGMIPLILESWIFLLMTNLIFWVVKSSYPVFYGKLTGYVNTIARAILYAGLITLPTVSTLAVYLGYFRTPLFIFGTSMAGAFLGYLIGSLYGGYILKSRKLWTIPILFAGTFAVFVWFDPLLANLALNSFPAFAAMSLSTISGGLAVGAIRKVLPRGYLVSETLSISMGIFSLLIFYLGLEYRINPWPFFSLSSVLVFEIAVWGTMVPLMWVVTQSTIAEFFSGKFILSDHRSGFRNRALKAQNHI